jgi:hypothetical protein
MEMEIDLQVVWGEIAGVWAGATSPPGVAQQIRCPP